MVSWSVGGGGGWKTRCIRIGYSELREAENREGISNLAESSRVTQYSILIGWRVGRLNTWFWLADEVWVFSCSIANGCQKFFSFGHNRVCWAMYKDREWAERLIFGSVRLFEKTSLNFFQGLRADDYYGAD